MTYEMLERANEISKKIKELREIIGFLECRKRRREKDIEEFDKGKKPFIPIPKWFGRGFIKNDKVKLDIPIECYPKADFEIDEECVNLILEHYKEKVEVLEKELKKI